MDFFLVNCSFQEKMAADTEHKTGGLFTRNFDSDKRETRDELAGSDRANRDTRMSRDEFRLSSNA